MPDGAILPQALAESVGAGGATLTDNVMFGSGARAVIEAAIRAAAQAGGAPIDARTIAQAAIASGEVMPGFFAGVGVSREDLLEALR